MISTMLAHSPVAGLKIVGWDWNWEAARCVRTAAAVVERERESERRGNQPLLRWKGVQSISRKSVCTARTPNAATLSSYSFDRERERERVRGEHSCSSGSGIYCLYGHPHHFT